MRRNVWQRTTAALLALLAQAGMMALLMLPPAKRDEHEAESVGLIFIQPMQMPEVAPPRPLSTPAVRRAIVPVIITSSDRDEPIEPVDIPDAITVTPDAPPRIDWYQAAETVVQDFMEREAERERHGEPLKSKPRVLQLPADGVDGPPAVTRLGNGDLVTRHNITDKLSVTCTHPQTPLAERFDALARHRPARCALGGAHSGIKPVAQGVELRKPRYLQRPLLIPDAPQLRSEAAPEQDTSDR